MKRGSEEGRRGSKEGGGIAHFFAYFLGAGILLLAGCREAPFAFQAPPPADHRLPFAAVVWQLDDKTQDFTDRNPSADGIHGYETSLTRTGSHWRPRLSMEAVSLALAAELKARLTQDAWVNGDPLESHMTFTEMARGAELFVGGEVLEASWDRSNGETGRFRLKVKLHATIGRANGEDLRRFWEKEASAEVPHSAWAGAELSAALDKLYAGEVEDLAKALTKEPAASALAGARPAMEPAAK